MKFRGKEKMTIPTGYEEVAKLMVKPFNKDDLFQSKGRLWVRFKDERPINLRKDGKCINMYLTIENHFLLTQLKKNLQCRTWNDFIDFYFSGVK